MLINLLSLLLKRPGVSNFSSAAHYNEIISFWADGFVLWPIGSATNDADGVEHVVETADDNEHKRTAESIDQANNQLCDKIGKHFAILAYFTCIAFWLTTLTISCDIIRLW